MNDFAGFIIALVILIFLIYITVQFVIPFLMIWVLPSLVFYTALFFIIRKNKVVPGELDFYITDRGLKQIGIYSLLPLAVHSGALFLFDVSEYGETIVFMNFILILFGAALFFAHYFENRRRFYSENQYVNLIVDKYMGLLNSMLFLKNDIQILLSDNLIPGNEADSHIAEIDALIERVKQERVKIESLFREPF
ncbi:MAG: hypothetical protein FJ088_11295, partial [Deltaproteobacteria bacterium]|nr:hypothetical protein [Deltaproteobacteria bacterium]